MVIPFGLTNAPATFQAFINNILRKYLDIFVIIYLNNILIYSRTEDNYVQYIGQVLRILQDSDLQVKLEKSIFYVKEIEYLGYIIVREEVKMDFNKIYIILEWPKLRNVSEI